MKAVIHIGMPKSGTSTIQAFLDMNRDALSQRGVLYDRFAPAFWQPVTSWQSSG